MRLKAYPSDPAKCKSCLFRLKENNVKDPYCEHCDYRVVEDPDHIIFRCPENYNLRCDMWDEISNVCPPARPYEHVSG